MGASESKLVFKQGIFRLQEKKVIAADDPYWIGFWDLPESTEDVFTLFSANDIRRTRDTSLDNLQTLLLAVTSRLFALRRHPSFPHPDAAPERHALNCVRVLTRLLPYIYEADNLSAWEERFFWGKRRVRTKKSREKTEVLFDEADPNSESQEGNKEDDFEDAKPLAEELLDTLVDFLFFSNFTIIQNERTASKVNYSIWSSGVGCNSPVSSNGHLENNRTEVLRLLLTISSKSMYMSSNLLPVKGVQALTYLVTCPDKQVVLSILCSLLNTTIKFNPASWRIPYDHVVVGDPKHLYVASCLQFLLVLLLYPIPEDGRGSPPKNYFRHFLGRVHRPQDFQFICDGMNRTLQQPLSATSSYLPGSQRPVRWAPEMIMLFWETIQCNKRFRAFIVDTDRGHDFIILLLFYAIENRTDPTKQGIVRMCVFVLQTLSVEKRFATGLNQSFNKQETLPTTIRIEDWKGTYGDFLVVSIHTLITGSKGKLDAIYPALLAIINNVAAYLENLNALSCLKIMQLFVSMSSPSFLLANETNHGLLASLLDAINAIIEHRYDDNRKFVVAVLKYRKRFEALRSFTLESGQAEIARLNERRKEDSESDDHSRSPNPLSRTGTGDSLRSPTSTRAPSLSNVPEESSAFAIGDDEDEDEHEDITSTAARSVSSPRAGHSRTPSASSTDDVLPTQLRGMSEKARGKMPANQPAFSRTNSMTSVASYAATSIGGTFAPSPEWIETWLPTLSLHSILTLISLSEGSTPRATLPATIEPSAPRIHTFEWTPLSMGWYESLLWSFICTSEMVIQRGTVGVWNGTGIKLFKVEKEIARGPSLMKPMGAVDAVGSSIVQRIGSLNLRSSAGQQAGQSQPNSPVVRDV